MAACGIGLLLGLGLCLVVLIGLTVAGHAMAYLSNLAMRGRATS